jgi:RNA-binding protein YhbY
METIKSHFKNHQNVKITVLKSFTRDRKKIKELSDEIVSKLGDNYTSRILGFTIFVNPHFGQTNLIGFGCIGKIYP